MGNLGINFTFLFVQLLNFSLLLGWPILSIVAILSLRKEKLSQTVQALWVLIILAIPFLGAIAYWLVRPAKNDVG